MILANFISITEWNAQSWTLLIILILSGLGLFLYGINRMSGSLKNIAGDKLKMIIQKTTDSPFKGILVGIIVTVLIQSSSGTTALIVGLVGAGLMTLPQAIGVIMGANIGTTLTVILIGLPISDYLIAFTFIGSFIYFFSKKKKTKEIGLALFGFGILFLGLTLMSNGLNCIFKSYEEEAKNLFQNFSKYPVLGLLLGTVFTALVQSSAAALGILQTLYAGGTIELIGAIAILIGSNIGTTITAIFSAIGGSTDSKRTAAIRTMFNVFGALLFMILLYPFTKLIHLIESNISMDPKMTIALAHVIFNIASTFVLFWFRNIMAKLAKRMFKSETDTNPIYLGLEDYSLIKKNTYMALEFIAHALKYMADLTIEYFKLTKAYSFENNPQSVKKGNDYEVEIDLLNAKIHDYLIKITQEGVDKKESNLLSKYLDTVKDMERIGDHLTNIMEFFEVRHEAKATLSEEGATDLKKMFDSLEFMVTSSLLAIETWDKDLARQVNAEEPKVDQMEEVYRKKHVIRINKGQCKVSDLDYYVDILSNLERIGDHTDNIALNVINDDYQSTIVTNFIEKSC
jgi:phosphate:Na+ symporter